MGELFGEAQCKPGLELLIDRLELRLKECRLHAEGLSCGSRDREGADVLVQEIKERLVALRSLRSAQRIY
jgi:hypothetical protein